MSPTFLLRPLLAGVLVAQLALPSAALCQMQETDAAMVAKPSQAHTFQAGTRLKGDELILQLLNRLTYGPRPGDLEHVRQIGVNAWLQQQLNPSSIDDSALDRRLAEYPAMQLPLGKLMEMYPNNRLVRQAMNGNAGQPGGDAERAIYANQMARYQQKKAGKKKDGVQDSDDAATPLPRPAAEIAALPPDQRFKALCRLTLPQIRLLRRSLAPDERAHLNDGFTAQQNEALAAFASPRNVVAAEDVQVKLLRDIYSERQLNEMMVDFWLNHFNVYMKKSQEAPYYIAEYEKRIRSYAMGNFEKLLITTAMSPAMLTYLDNSSSTGPHSDVALRSGFRGGPNKKKDSGLNENYGRELMELHTVGVNGGYSQQDVTEVAKVFTGWTVGKGRGQDAEAQAEFDASKHEPGNKMVLGQKISDNGEKEGLAVLHLLANSPQTARFISTKLAVRFVSDDPPKTLVDRMAGTFIETHGDIRRVLATMLNSPEFTSAGAYRTKVKTPQEYVVSAVRAAGSNVDSAAALEDVIAELGMPIYGHQTPEGYSMKSDAWNNTAALVSRMNFALALATNRVAGISTDFRPLLGSQPEELGAEAKDLALENALLHVAVSDRTQALILRQTSSDTATQAASLRQVSGVNGKRDPLAIRGVGRSSAATGESDTQTAMAAGLIFGSPEFQRR